MPATEPGLVSVVPKVDGRRLRRERTRQAIIEAFTLLLRRKPAMPTASQIAEEAGCSVRSVFERFSDLEALSVAAADYAIFQGKAEAAARNSISRIFARADGPGCWGSPERKPR